MSNYTPPAVPRWVIVFCGVVLLIIVGASLGCSVPATPEPAAPMPAAAQASAPEPAATIPTVTPAAPATDIRETTWAAVVRLYEKEQPGNPANLYVDALISLHQGDITGEDVLETARASNSFMTFCALERAWVYSDVGGYENSVMDDLNAISYDRWPAKDWGVCLHMEGISSPFGYDTPLEMIQSQLAATPTSDVLAERILSQHLAMAALAEAKWEEAEAAFFGMAWPDVVQLYEKNQGDNPTSLYTDALMSLNQGDITGEDVLETVEASNSFTTHCAMVYAWKDSNWEKYETEGYKTVARRLAERRAEEWPSRDFFDCDDLDWSGLTN